MAGLLTGVETAKRSLIADQTVINTVGNNISNVNTPGYSRQSAEVTQTDPYTLPDYNRANLPFQLGTGVQVSAITRAHDAFTQQQLNVGAGDQGQYNALQTQLQNVQSAFAEPGTGGLNSLLTAFFNSFQQLSQNPADTSQRELVRQQGEQVAAQFQNVYNGLTRINDTIASSVTADVKQANSLAQQVASLDKQIVASIQAGAQPNTLMDQRDQLIQQLGGLVGATSQAVLDPSGKPTGAVNVLVEGQVIVDGLDSNAIALPSGFTVNGGVAYLTDGQNQVALQTGEIAGLALASQKVTAYQTNLNSVASTFISAVNTQHAAGYGLDGSTGQPFFNGTGAADIQVSAAIQASTAAIAAASAPASGQPMDPGNGNNAVQIADIANSQLFGAATINGYYGSIVTQIGQDEQSATQHATNQQQVMTQLQNQRSSVSGVNLDEELTNMLQYQQSYQAAAKFLTTVDTLMQNLLDAVTP